MVNILALANQQRFSKAEVLRRYKALTVHDPDNAEHWYKLSLCLFSKGDNPSGWKALTNAKKLGSEKALKLISNILSEYKKKSPDKAQRARSILFGEGV